MKQFSVFLFSMIALIACAQNKNVKSSESHPAESQLKNYSIATFAAGCFWHEEALFESVKGVKEAISGYAGGTTNNPNYSSVETGETGHAETVDVYYDPKEVNFETLVKVFFAGQDPTQINGQGPDLGTQYRSIAFYRTPQEKSIIENQIKSLTASGIYSKPIVTQVVPFTKFWKAEDYHQDYIEHHPNSGYVQYVSIPEIKKFQKQYPQLVKPDHVF
ncbi:MAG: peptide-methionine (S)-S-oxide reductase MsrA [Bacteroidetes bacterium]|nr:peptide-methionine (S)-S-oxide reductase MsrA [Bacteroidota bacterium]